VIRDPPLHLLPSIPADDLMHVIHVDYVHTFHGARKLVSDEDCKIVVAALSVTGVVIWWRTAGAHFAVKTAVTASSGLKTPRVAAE
jgi:hypothetical protein